MSKADPSTPLGMTERGVTLVSVMVAVAILGIALTMAVSAFYGASRLARVSGEYGKASNFAEGVMEQVKTRPFDSVRSEEVTQGLPGLKDAACEVTVTEPEPGLKQVLVTCSWDDGKRARKAEFSTLIAKGASR